MDTATIDREVERLMALPYRIELTPDPGDGGYFVRIPDLPYCMSQGDTVEEAIEMIRDAQRGWLAVALENGNPIPEPRPPRYSEKEYSGKFNVRVPRSVHRAVVQAAEAEGVSLNLFVASTLARAVGREEAIQHTRGQPCKEAAATG